jgi:hypothetical protein
VENSKSYYDWQQSFKCKQDPKKRIKSKKINSLGIDELSLKTFLKKWKIENL